MAKETGLGDNMIVGGVNISGDVSAVDNVGGGPSLLEVTSIDKLGVERLGGLISGELGFTAWFNPTGLHPAASSLPTTNTLVTYLRGTTLGGPSVCLVGRQVDYGFTRGADGALTVKVDAVSDGYGVEWGTQLTPGLRTDTAATNGTGVDFTAASTTFGWQAYLQVTGFTGTSCTVTVQDSADNVTFASLAGGAFTAATGVTWQRLAGGPTDTVRRYLRVITTGTFSSCTFSVVFARNATAVTF